ncbi:hypothetical protein FRB98_003436 [Tulasnella sp. 332]|nr:hypothetical protein FRB98_003436 [Tulasnella sp. 332]
MLSYTSFGSTTTTCIILTAVWAISAHAGRLIGLYLVGIDLASHPIKKLERRVFQAVVLGLLPIMCMEGGLGAGIISAFPPFQFGVCRRRPFALLAEVDSSISLVASIYASIRLFTFISPSSSSMRQHDTSDLLVAKPLALILLNSLTFAPSLMGVESITAEAIPLAIGAVVTLVVFNIRYASPSQAPTPLAQYGYEQATIRFHTAPSLKTSSSGDSWTIRGSVTRPDGKVVRALEVQPLRPDVELGAPSSPAISPISASFISQFPPPPGNGQSISPGRLACTGVRNPVPLGLSLAIPSTPVYSPSEPKEGKTNTPTEPPRFLGGSPRMSPEAAQPEGLGLQTPSPTVPALATPLSSQTDGRPPRRRIVSRLSSLVPPTPNYACSFPVKPSPALFRSASSPTAETQANQSPSRTFFPTRPLSPDGTATEPATPSSYMDRSPMSDRRTSASHTPFDKSLARLTFGTVRTRTRPATLTTKRSFTDNGSRCSGFGALDDVILLDIPSPVRQNRQSVMFGVSFLDPFRA